MRYTIKIQRNRSFHLPGKIKNDIKSKGFDKVEWILNYSNNSVQINFLKDIETPKDKTSNDIIKLYRNVYNYSMMKVPNIVYNYFKCQIFDYVVIDVKDNGIFISICKRIEISEISGLIRESGGC